MLRAIPPWLENRHKALVKQMSPCAPTWSAPRDAVDGKAMDGRLEQLVKDAGSQGPRSQRAAAKLMSVMTNQPQRLGELLAGSREWPQPRLVLGVTGAPGSGKSTITDHLAAEFRDRFPDRQLGIVAVDPSSPFTGGALLGDRVRMMRHATDPHVFIRSLASRGHLGGLALGARGVVRVMGLIGCDVVIVETVGVGQSEVEIAQNADLVVVVLAPGQGDSVQMLKAGLLEAADLFVVNKSDREGADLLHQQLLSMLQRQRLAQLDLAQPIDEPLSCSGPAIMGSHGPVEATPAPAVRSAVDAASPPVFRCSALKHEGISQLMEELEGWTARQSAAWQARRRDQTVEEIRLAVLEEVRRRISAQLAPDRPGVRELERVIDGSRSVSAVVEELLIEAAGARRTAAGA